MKKTDIAMIIFILAVSGGLAYAIVGAIPGLKLEETSVNVKIIDKYTADVPEPSEDIFNKSAINPTVDITIGGGSNSNLDRE
jgi:hypothetical protein